jgi:DNA-binding transcriptional LysR family regulator
MQTLEMQAGGKLFERSRFGVRSTVLGDMLAREGRAIARRLKDAVEVTARHRSGLRGTLRLGFGPLLGMSLVPGLSKELLRRHPQLHLTLQSDRPQVLVDQLVDGRHDLVIAPSWLDKPPPGIDRVLLVADDMGVFCGNSHPLAQVGELSAGATELNWIVLGTASPFDQHVREMLVAAGMETPRTEITILGEASMLLRVLAQGRHLSVLPHFPLSLLREYFPITELTLQAPPAARDVYLWCRSNALEDPAFAGIRKTVLGYVAGLSAK